MKDKIKKVNDILLKGEPENISVDKYSGYTGYKPQNIIDAMNEVFELGEWGFTEINSEFLNKGEDGKPKLSVTSIEVWLKGIEFKPMAYGQSRITKGDYGDAKKGSQTDAIKKALSYFSIGNRAYLGLLEDKPKNKPKYTAKPGAMYPEEIL